jgi:transposase-like protein/IS1 family transposase
VSRNADCKIIIGLSCEKDKADVTCVRCQHQQCKKFGYFGKRRIQRWRCQSCKATFSEPVERLDSHYIDLDIAARALEMMMEGMSVRAISRITGLHIRTILALMISAGRKCKLLLDMTVRNLNPALVEADELHTFVGCHDKRLRSDSPREWGDCWTWLAMDSETKLIISHHIGGRDLESAWELMRDLRDRTDNRFQLTSDGLAHYRKAVDAHFATDIDFAQLVKLFSTPDISGPDWMSAMSRVTGTITSVRCGHPEPRFVSTSHIERLNLSVRTHLRRYVRRTTAHSRKLANHKACFALWVAWYNFVRVNSAIRQTPCMAAGITSTIWTMRDLLATHI